MKDDHLEGATRQHLADTALTRALREWASEHVKRLAEDLHRAMAENATPKDRQRARSALDSIRELMRRFLDPDAAGGGMGPHPDAGMSGDSRSGFRQQRNPIQYGSCVTDIFLEEGLNDVTLIRGTRVPLKYRCVERSSDGTTRPVKGVPVVLLSEPEGMVTLNSDGTLTANSSGVGKIWLETTDASIRSNDREFWTLDAIGVCVEVPSVPLLQGQMYAPGITYETADGPLSDCLVDAEVLDASLASIGRHGRMKIGLKEGNAVLRVRFGPNPSDQRDFIIPIGPERVEPPRGNGGNGSDVPEILLCGEFAPGMEDLQPEFRTIPGGPDYPTIYEDPRFEGIVWINPASKEAMRVRRGAGGSSGLGKIGNRTFMHFVALKCFDILKRLYVRQKIAGDAVTEYEYMQYAVDAEMDCADFIDAAWEMTDDLLAREAVINGS